MTEIFDCSRVKEDERVDIDNGNIWRDYGRSESLECGNRHPATPSDDGLRDQ